MNQYSVFNVLTGRIVKTGFANRLSADLQAGSGEAVIYELLDEKSIYIIDNVVRKRPINSITHDKLSCLAYDQEIVTLAGVPLGATIAIDSEEIVADGTDILLTFYEPKQYTIKVTNFPDTDYEVTINAN